MSCRVSGAVSREHWRLSNDFRFQRIVDRQARTAVPAGDRILESTPFERPVRTSVGTWLSLVEHSLGVRGVGSSNLPVPTNFAQVLRLLSQNRGEARPPAAARRSPTSRHSGTVLREARTWARSQELAGSSIVRLCQSMRMQNGGTRSGTFRIDSGRERPKYFARPEGTTAIRSEFATM